MANVKSGTFWVTWANANAKNSTSTDDLAEPFRTRTKAFIQALQAAGATVTIRVTTRSDKRAYLFHWSWLIGLGKAKASDAAPKAGVPIQWDWGDPASSVQGAKDMINGFGLAVPPSSTNAPALDSNHISGNAIDMDIAWTGVLAVKKNDGTTANLTFMSDVNANTALHAVGASYGVFKLATDAPHWSVDGH